MDDERYTFKASRLTAGNFFFPVRIEVSKTPQGSTYAVR